MIRAAAILALWLPVAATAQPVPEPDSYETEHYRGPVPVSLTGGTVVDNDAAYALWKTGQVAFVDVLPRAPKPENLPEGTIWRDQPRHSIPGAIWLPNVGYGALADVTDAYFRDGMKQVTGGDPDYPVVFFCLRECWMSWNAAKRAIEEYGYTHVFWYPDGTDGWTFEEYPTALLVPS
ncbi:PQQ-dependent catabolism-associated CXXCW motif protein [Yoonia sediminilitoris]|uniref:PQQ-dependent catabolism-associated CXXCW motif protein n=1 Tax=Yoonia sediminilitoris TaxID=1286148 RepID=A0A2T6KD07_9RHOB|nr:PQQ-dependent catabolism-associated CXXCW motif protein [Yoonia sediminilitoris]PUB12843.1 PQQ-dependent catabolism-associated CXXCW motif protein [Yoonia sediminilitoris]RCW94322.1 PQQ-dependent catabolism-associated CXXCW motif protein [Yoonia sediminilitoris]